jgi:hypothetical protein
MMSLTYQRAGIEPTLSFQVTASQFIHEYGQRRLAQQVIQQLPILNVTKQENNLYGKTLP